MGKSLSGLSDPTRANAPRIDDMFAWAHDNIKSRRLPVARSCRNVRDAEGGRDTTSVPILAAVELRIIEGVGGCTGGVVGVNVVDKGGIN